MELFNRTKSTRIQWEEDWDHFLIEVTLCDEFHDIALHVTIDSADLQLRRITPHITRTPYPICPSAQDALQQCIGLRIQPGISLIINKTIGGSCGCAHLTQLLLDACHAGAQALLSIHSRQQGQAGNLPPAEKIAFLESKGLSPRNRCLAYSQSPQQAKPCAE